MRGVCVDVGAVWRDGGWGRGVVVEGVMLRAVKMKLFVRIRQQTIFSCVYEFIVTSGQLFPVHGELTEAGGFHHTRFLSYEKLRCDH